MNQLIPPYGGELVNLLVDAGRAAALKDEARDLPSIDLGREQLCELELLLNGGFSPLTGYLGRADYQPVLAERRLADGRFWPWPLALRLTEKQAQGIEPGRRYALRDPEGFMPAVLTVSDVWPADTQAEAAALGTALPGSVCVGGTVEGVALPPRHDFTDLRLTPAELREQFRKRGWKRVIAYQTAQAIHRMHQDFAVQASLGREANLLLHGVAGVLPNNEASYFSRVRAYQAALTHFPPASTLLALLPLADAGLSPREVALRAIVARNYGCTHLIVGGDAHDGGAHRRGVDIVGDVLAESGAAMEEVGVALVPFDRMVYVEDRAQFLPEDAVPAGARAVPFPAAEMKRRLDHDLQIPSWFAWPDVIAEIRRAQPPRHRQGFCVFCTGLSGAGKSTIAKALQIKLLEMGGRQVTLLDGDVVRKHLSSELGFSREHRDLNIRRIGYVASEIVKHRGIAICAPIAPYAASRREVRRMIEQYGGFFEIHVSTPIETCEARDRKGLYAKARAGLVKEFTGVSDPYEVPEHPELAIDTSNVEVDEAVQRILLTLEREGYLR
jgi:sulfate adenylyltransferase